MNKKYTVDEECKVTVITDTGDTIQRTDKYTKNTDEILSLENAIEGFNSKVNLLRIRLKEVLNEISSSKILLLFIPVVILIFYFIMSAFGNIPSTIALLFTLISGSIVATKQIIQLIRNNNEKGHITQRINEVSQTQNRVQKRIDNLSKDKTPIKTESINQFIDVKTITDFNFDTRDYFIENYLINKRAKEMTRDKGKVKKRVLTKTDNKYII